jgi:hypothetical protein
MVHPSQQITPSLHMLCFTFKARHNVIPCNNPKVTAHDSRRLRILISRKKLTMSKNHGLSSQKTAKTTLPARLLRIAKFLFCLMLATVTCLHRGREHTHPPSTCPLNNYSIFTFY